MRSMAITDFKAHALKVLDKVSKDQEDVIITKRGKPLAKIVPFRTDEEVNKSGKLKDMLIHMGDIETPLGADLWESSK